MLSLLVRQVVNLPLTMTTIGEWSCSGQPHPSSKGGVYRFLRLVVESDSGRMGSEGDKRIWSIDGWMAEWIDWNLTCISRQDNNSDTEIEMKSKQVTCPIDWPVSNQIRIANKSFVLVFILLVSFAFFIHLALCEKLNNRASQSESPTNVSLKVIQ